ncbi:MAG: hypothetical protein JRN28_00755 [Nitrososphaerota archaeon]|nr:hypothetical protein [Nitrososphaerota archaeon]
MKNQSFHPHKIRIYEAPKLDFDQLKSRTISTLDKLGQQRLSTEPGGYTLENWVKGVNVLLDEFEEKAGTARLSTEYLGRRRELDARLSGTMSVAQTDEEIVELRKEMSQIEKKIEDGRSTATLKIEELKAEEAKCSNELEQERSRLAAVTKIQAADSFFSRLFGRGKVQPTRPESRIDELQSRLSSLSTEIAEQKELLKSIDAHAPGSKFAEDWAQLDSMEARLRGLDDERITKNQSAKERAELAGLIADAVSRIP